MTSGQTRFSKHMYKVLISFFQPIRFVRFNGRSVNHGLLELDQPSGPNSWCWWEGMRPDRDENVQSTSWILDIKFFMVNWHLSSQGINWPIPYDHILGSSLDLIRSHVDLKLTTDHLLLIECQAQARLTCCYQDWAVWKLVNASQNVIWGINFSFV